MSHPTSGKAREKLVTALPPQLRVNLKIRAFELGLDIQDATEHAVRSWMATSSAPNVDADGAKTWGVLLPEGMPDSFRSACSTRELTFVQGISQAVSGWLDKHPSPTTALVAQPLLRILVANQKGGVGKTFLAAGIAQALAEMGLRVLLVDYDPQGHLTTRMGLDDIPDGGESLLTHMLGEAKQHLRNLLVAMDEERFGRRLHVLPACDDAFLLDARMATVRAREGALMRALSPIEADYDAVIIDGPPSLGLAMDMALFYVGRREGERADRSGVLIPVWADSSSHKAFKMLNSQIRDLSAATGMAIDRLGIIVNAYDSRRGTLVKSNLQQWEKSSSPSVLAVFEDLKEARESADGQIPLLEYAPDCLMSSQMRDLAKELAA